METMTLLTFRLFLLIYFRCLGSIWFAPVLGGDDSSRLCKLSLSFFLSVLVTPIILDTTDFQMTSRENWNLLVEGLLAFQLLQEFFLGATIGLCLKLVFQGAALAGDMIGKLGGISVAGSFDPISGAETTAVASFLKWIFLVVFIVCGGVEAFLDGFLNLFSVVRPGSIVVTNTLLESIVNLVTCVFVLGLKVCAPVSIATLLVYLVVGINGRLVQGFNLALMAFNFNSLLTFVVLFLSLGVICHVFQTSITEYTSIIFSFMSGGN